VAGFYDHGDDPLGAIKGGGFLKYMIVLLIF
jgi:hypothetical protein